MRGKTKIISSILSIVMLFTLFAGFGTMNANAFTIIDFTSPDNYITMQTSSDTDAIYNFSELTDSSYATKGGVSVFDGAVTLTATDNAAPNNANFIATAPDGSEVKLTSSLKAKQLAATVTLGAGETLIAFYGGTDSGGTAGKDIEMAITDTATNTVVATETNSEKSEAKPYTISYTSANGGTYKVAEAGATSVRTLMYALIVTESSSYNTDIGTGSTITTPAPTEASTPAPKESIDPNTVSAIQLVSARGWLETAYVKWTNNVAVEKYNVYYKGENDAEYTKIDDELIRYYGSYYRADAVGLKSGKYTLKVAAVIGGVETDVKETEVVTVQAHDREGFAFDSRSPYYNADGVGAYKNDGTLKDNAQVIYIDNTNKDTVKHTVMVKGKANEGTGLVDILSLREKNDAETTPLVIRMIGKIDAPSGINSAGYAQIKATSNITFEGIGDDATAYKWSLLVRDSNNIEIKNIAVMKFYDDGISLDTDNFNCWIHNCDIFYGQNRGGDQVKGDGSLDIKSGSSWTTFSYNHFWECGKTSLCGMTGDAGSEFFVTYHHNWFDHSDSRHPRVRAGTVHIYNNFYDGVAKYGAGATTAGNLFVESNYFRNTGHPVLISMQGSDIGSSDDGKGTFSGEDGGMIKMYGNILMGGGKVIDAKDNSVEFDAYIADTRDEQVPNTYKTKKGGTTYNNFDTDANMYAYVADNAADVPTIVEAYAGRIESGDFEFDFDDAKDDSRYDLNTELDTLLVNYKSSLVTSYTTDAGYPSTSGEVAPEPSETPVPLPTPTPTPTPDTSEYDYEITSAEFAADDSLAVELKYTGSDANPTAKLIVVAYTENGAIADVPYMFDINGTTIDGLSYTKPNNAKFVKIYIWNSIESAKPLSKATKRELK